MKGHKTKLFGVSLSVLNKVLVITRSFSVFNVFFELLLSINKQSYNICDHCLFWTQTPNFRVHIVSINKYSTSSMTANILFSVQQQYCPSNMARSSSQLVFLSSRKESSAVNLKDCWSQELELCSPVSSLVPSCSGRGVEVVVGVKFAMRRCILYTAIWVFNILISNLKSW